MKHFLKIKPLTTVSIGILMATLVSGCAAHKDAPASIETARLAVQEANRYEAPRYASSELNVAEEKLRQAEKEWDDGHYDAARRLGEQATVDARYAQTRAQSEHAQVAAVENHDTTQTLKNIR